MVTAHGKVEVASFTDPFGYHGVVEGVDREELGCPEEGTHRSVVAVDEDGTFSCGCIRSDLKLLVAISKREYSVLGIDPTRHHPLFQFPAAFIVSDCSQYSEAVLFLYYPLENHCRILYRSSGNVLRIEGLYFVETENYVNSMLILPVHFYHIIRTWHGIVLLQSPSDKKLLKVFSLSEEYGNPLCLRVLLCLEGDFRLPE